MGVFLLFDSANRLVEMAQLGSGPFGAFPPEKVFPQREGLAGFTSMEVAPQILLELRPRTISILVGHCHRTEVGLQVDDLPLIKARLKAQYGLEASVPPALVELAGRGFRL